ncbi:MAG: alpha/beta hydrolase [Chloroflexi bacterium]|nr:alpha/beta hydrolase [Chloroflexota bacterium]
MRFQFLIINLLVLGFITSCQSEVASPTATTEVVAITTQPTAEPTLTPLPTNTAVPTIPPTLTATLPPTATATPADTATPAATSIPRESVGVDTEDGERLFATIIGNRYETIAILSNMSGKTKGDWRQVAEFLAMQEITVITYDYRETITNLSENAQNGVLDLEAMVRLAREIGGVDIFIIGASMGGTITAKTALSTNPTGVVLISAPSLARSLAISDDEFASITAPLLIVNTRNDDFYTDTIRMIDVATAPKTSEIFSGAAHGTEIFRSDDGADLQQLLVSFMFDLIN